MAGVQPYTRATAMSSNNPYNSGVFKRGDNLTAKHLETLRAGTTGNVQSRNVDNFVRRLPSGHILTSKRKSKPPGTSLIYVEITASTNFSTYTADIFDNPIDRNLLTEDITLRAMQHSAGVIPDSSSGQGLYAILVDEVYYLSNYSVFYGS